MISVNKVLDGGFDIKMLGTGDTLVDEYTALTEYLIKHQPELFDCICIEMERRLLNHDNDPGEH